MSTFTRLYFPHRRPAAAEQDDAESRQRIRSPDIVPDAGGAKTDGDVEATAVVPAGTPAKSGGDSPSRRKDAQRAARAGSESD